MSPSSPDQKSFSALGRMVVPVADADGAPALALYRGILGFEVLHDAAVGGYRCLHVGLPGQARVGLWLMPATTARESELISRQHGGGRAAAASAPPAGPCSSCTRPTCGRPSAALRAHGVRVWNEREEGDGRSLRSPTPTARNPEIERAEERGECIDPSPATGLRSKGVGQNADDGAS